MAKNLAKAKQQPDEAELSLYKNYLISSSTLLSKNIWRYSKKCIKKQVHLSYEVIMINGDEIEAENEK